MHEQGKYFLEIQSRPEVSCFPVGPDIAKDVVTGNIADPKMLIETEFSYIAEFNPGIHALLDRFFEMQQLPQSSLVPFGHGGAVAHRILRGVSEIKGGKIPMAAKTDDGINVIIYDVLGHATERHKTLEEYALSELSWLSQDDQEPAFAGALIRIGQNNAERGLFYLGSILVYKAEARTLNSLQWASRSTITDSH